MLEDSAAVRASQVANQSKAGHDPAGVEPLDRMVLHGEVVGTLLTDVHFPDRLFVWLVREPVDGQSHHEGRARDAKHQQNVACQ